MTATSSLRRTDLTHGSVSAHLLRLSVPMVWGLLAVISFQLVNAFYISRLGTQALAAISYTFPVTYAVFSVFLGFAVATSSVLSRLIGAGKTEDVRRVTSHAILLVFLVSLVLSFAGFLARDPLFRAMGAPESLLPLIHDYMTLYFLGIFIVSMPIVGNAALRASGDTLLPAVILTVSAFSNAILDPILIFGLFGFPRLELQGAALSTLVSNTLACLAGFRLMRRKGLFDMAHLRDLAFFRDSARRLLVIAFPAGVTNCFPSVTSFLINGLLSRSGSEAVAAFGAASRIEAFAILPLMALFIGMAPLVGQNWGAGCPERAQKTVRFAALFCLVWSLVVSAFLAFFSRGWAALFTDDAEVALFLGYYLATVPMSYGLGLLANCWSSCFNAIGKPHYASSFIFLRAIVFSAPAAWLGYAAGGVPGLFLGLCLSNALGGALIHIGAERAFIRFGTSLKSLSPSAKTDKR